MLKKEFNMKVIYTLIFCGILSNSFAQSAKKGGKINYKETIQMEMNFDSDDPRMAEIKGMLPSSHTNQKVLTFNETSSLYSNVEKDNKEQKELPNEEGLAITLDIQQPENIIFYDFADQIAVQQRSFMGRTFLVQGQAEKRWKITNDQKEILGYKCRKATLDDTTNVTAWYTVEIPAFTGPDTYNGLPGLILEVELKNRNIVATDINIGFDEKITAPEKGKKVTLKQFNKIMAQKFEEMQNEFEGSKNGNIMIIRSDQ